MATDMDSAAEAVAAERDENTCRKDMTVSELVALGRELERIERPKAAERQAVHGGTAPGRKKNTSAQMGGSVRAAPAVEPEKPPETREVVASALGTSRSTYARMKYVAARADDDTTDPKVHVLAGGQVVGWRDVSGVGGTVPALEVSQDTGRAGPGLFRELAGRHLRVRFG